MAEYKKKDGDITLFINKKTKETQPDFKGNLFFCGKELEVALWKRKSQSGKDFLSGRVSQPRQVEEKVDDSVDDINF